jgi:hypothetical protein
MKKEKSHERNFDPVRSDYLLVWRLCGAALPERQRRARRDEIDRVQRVRDRHPYRPVNRSTRRLP